MTEQRILVTVCTYNERDNLEKLIPQIHTQLPEADVLVVDDNSPDGTGQLADQLAQEDQRVHVLHRAGKLGLGSATIAGFRYGIEQDYDYLINMDADFSHHPRLLPSLLSRMTDADVAIGSRYVPGGGVEGWGLLRHFMSRSINCYARCLLGLRTHDNSGSYRCYRVHCLRQIDFNRVRSRGYSFQEEILYLCRRIGCRFVVVPIVFEDRRYGTSKISWRESVSALWIIFRLTLDRLTQRHRSS